MASEPRPELRALAERFRELHHAPKLLILPNVWDPLGARMLESLGFPAVATASAAVAYAHAVDDGERLPFETVLEVISGIASAIAVPLTADLESGYAEAAEEVAMNVRRAMAAGAVGVNLEDSREDGRAMRPIETQCSRIHAVRAMARAEGVPLVINARVDVFLDPSDRAHADRIAEAVDRGRAYLEAGADCVYPIGPADAGTAAALREGIQAPVNLYLSAGAAPLSELESIGIARVSLGPGLLKASVAAMRRVARNLLEGRSYESFTTEAASTNEILGYINAQSRGTA